MATTNGSQVSDPDCRALRFNDDGANWFALTDPLGNALTFTAAGMKPITELPHKIRPSVTAGDGTTSINVWLHGRGANR